MKFPAIPIVLISMSTVALANIAPTVVIQSAAMRPGTTLMDVVYRVNDPDDATVKTRALAFVDGVRSFAKVLRPVTFVEGTAAYLGDAIPTNTNHTLTWDVGTDWDIDLGQVKFEVLALDGRGLLPIDWISIPAAGANPALTISKDTPGNAAVLNALFWQYAAGDPALTLANGVLKGNAASGVFAGVPLANGTTLQHYSVPYLFKQMNLDPASSSEVAYANTDARAGLASLTSWHAANRPYSGLSIILGWGSNGAQLAIPTGLTNITDISSGSYFLALSDDGKVFGWGDVFYQPTFTPPTGLSGVTAISVGGNHNLALKNDGTVAGWGNNAFGQTTIPASSNEIIAISAGSNHNLALASNGTAIAWGWNDYGTTNIPEGLADVIAVSAGRTFSLALKSDGSVVGWGNGEYNEDEVPAGLSGVTAIDSGPYHVLALKGDGTVSAWGRNSDGQCNVPEGLSGVIKISTGTVHSMALKSDGTVVAWGGYNQGEILDLAGLTGINAISAGSQSSIALKFKAP